MMNTQKIINIINKMKQINYNTSDKHKARQRIVQFLRDQKEG